MKRRSLGLVLLLGAAGGAGAARAAEGLAEPVSVPAGSSWLMMVTTQNVDPAREREFNDWYDRIDIPDVLEVPGYVRARRGLEQRPPGAALEPSGPLNYVALYDIRTSDIDKTIIKMLMASWGMEKAHHSTPLLKVTERVYFQEDRAARDAPAPAAAGAGQYLYLAKFPGSADPVARRKFDRWYDRQYVPAVLTARGVVRITRYRLYWVLMDQPVAVPEHLSLIEIDADSAEEARQSIESVHVAKPAVAAALFLEINDVHRP